MTNQDGSDIVEDASRVAERALAEDGRRDVTTDLVRAAGLRAEARVEYRGGGVLAGLPYAEAVCHRCELVIEWSAAEGSAVAPGTEVARVSGDLAAVLRAERPLLNLLQRACGVATHTRAFVEAVAGTTARILHTRKTSPGLRGLEVSAVLAGGGHSHRLGLDRAVLIKDNHWAVLAARGIPLADVLAAALEQGIDGRYVEVEDVAQLRAACDAGATRLLIDNQAPETVRAWAVSARELAPDIEIEASGGISIDTVRDYALAGADFISIGALTHSVAAADLALEIDRIRPVPGPARA